MLPYHESIVMSSPSLPVRIILRKSDATYKGCEFHWHEELEFYYVCQGGVCLNTGNESQWIYPGQAGFVNWCQPHRGSAFLDQTLHYIIQISPSAFEKETVLPPKGRQPVSFLAMLMSASLKFPTIFDQHSGITACFNRLIKEAGSPGAGSEFAVKACIFDILAILVRHCQSMPGRMSLDKDTAASNQLKQMLLFISDRYMDSEQMALPALAKRFGFSVPYLCRFFKNHTNVTLTDYINELRISRAAELIRNGTPLLAASEMTGFHDYNYFSRVFKKYNGYPPSFLKKH